VAKKLVILYLVDGARPDVLGDLLAAGKLPNIRRHIVEPGAFRTASSVLPSTTGPAYLPFLTGCFPGTVNIPGIRWLDRKEYRRRRAGKYRFRSYNGIEAPWFNTDLPRSRPTLFELFERPFSIHSLITRGIPGGHNLTLLTRPLSYLYAHLTDRWKIVDKIGHRHLMQCLDRDPDFIFAVFPAVDSFSHLNNPQHDLTFWAYGHVDRSVGEVAKKLQRLGRYEETLWIMTSDHGLTATHNHLDLALFFQKRRIPTLYYPIIWKRNPQASVMISGNALGQVYFLNGADGRPALEDEIKTRLGPLWEELLVHEEIDFMVSRCAGGRPGSMHARGPHGESAYKIVASRGSAVIVRRDGRYTYEPLEGDPLGLGALMTPLNEQEALAATFDSDYPDALVQIDQLFSCDRSGDLVVISKNGHDLREAYEWPEHHSSHGSLHREHMRVPLLVNRKGLRPGPARTADVFNTILTYGRSLIE
jgi:hypothetical protein